MDQKLFSLINHQWTSPALDSFMATMSSLVAWAPLLAVVAVLAAMRGGFRARAMLTVLAVVIAIMDVGVSDTIKKAVDRPRPREAQEGVRVVDLQPGALRILSAFKPAVVQLSAAPVETPTGHSFPSGHVINTFSAATVLTLFYKKRGLLAFIPAALVGYSRVYTGAHWPSDVMVTAFLGIGATLLLVIALELAWRKFGGRLMPRVYSEHPALLEGGRRMKPRNLLFLFLGILTLLRLVYLSQVELVADEAYYYMWSQRLDLSYYSKGPGVALAIRLGTALFGANEFGVRCLSPLLSLGTSLIMFYFARRIYNESVGIWTVLAMNALPIFNVGSLLMTIDPLSIFFWAAALFTFWLALEKGAGFNWHWPFTGLLIGLGFLAKYTNAMELISIVLVLAFTRRFRVAFLRSGFYSMLVVFLICTAPVVVWNERMDWITLTHLRERGNLNTGFAMHFMEPLTFIGGQLLVYSPLIFIGMMMALWWSREEAAKKFKPRFLALFALPILIMYGLLSFKHAGQPNWTALAYISLGILAAALWHDAMEEQPKKQKWVAWALGTGIFMSVAFFSLDMVRSAGIPFPYKWDPGSRLLGWKTMAAAVEDYRGQFEKATDKPVFLISKNYQTSALLSFYLPDKTRVEGADHPLVYIPESQAMESQFSFWPKYDDFVDGPKKENAAQDYYTEEGGKVNPFTGRNALYITDDIDNTPPSSIERGFEKVEMVKMFDITRHGMPLKQIRIFACYNYQTVPL